MSSSAIVPHGILLVAVAPPPGLLLAPLAPLAIGAIPVAVSDRPLGRTLEPVDAVDAVPA